MIPLRDSTPTTITPVVTIAVVASNVLVFLATWNDLFGTAASFGAVPFHFTGLEPDYNPNFPPETWQWWFPARALTSAWLHGGVMHIAMNMWFLWVFGDNIEQRLGLWRYIAFYIASALGAVVAQVASNPAGAVPMVGASGAVSGVLGAYIRLFPRARVLGLVPIGFVFLTVQWSALMFIGMWFVLQAVNAIALAGVPSGTAWWAHIGGFVVGFVLGPALAKKRRRVTWNRS